MSNNVDHPKHYNSHPSGVECITITEHMNFNVGNAVKYLWRAGLKSGPSQAATEAAARSEQTLEDLKKARWYGDREIKRLGGNMSPAELLRTFKHRPFDNLMPKPTDDTEGRN